MLLFEFHGSDAEVASQDEGVREITAGFGAAEYRSTTDAAERTALWRGRHDAFYASAALRPGSRSLTTDVCVPISRLAECVTEARFDLDSTGLLGTMVGHVGDGNFHVQLLIDPDDPDEFAAADAFSHRLVERALAMGGTCTGEHGVGLRKRGYLMDELPGGVEVMKAIKRSLDPGNILNPGKVIDL